MGEEKTALAAPALSRLASRETSPSTYAPRALARPHEEDAVWRSMRAGGEQDALAVLGVPPWRPLMHHAATELGYADVHVPGGSHSVSVEELQRGWIASSPVASDTGTIRQSIYERLHHADMLMHISDMLDHVRSSRRTGPRRIVSLPSSAPVPHGTLGDDGALAAFIRDLSDRQLPIEHVAKCAQRSVRSERLLDLLWQAPAPDYVPIPRAVWWIRRQGALKAKEASYTRSWTYEVVEWLRQLLHAPLHPQAWCERWTYATALVLALLRESLLDSFVWHMWLVQQLDCIRDARRACIAQLVAMHLPAMLTHPTVSPRMVASLARLACETTWLGAQAQSLLSYCEKQCPAMLVHARALLDDPQVLFQHVPQMDETLSMQAELLHAAVFPLLPHDATWDAAAVRILDSQLGITPMFLDYFLPREASTTAFAVRRLKILYEWACTPKRRGIHGGVHRAYTATALVRLLNECQSQRLTSSDGRLLPCPWHPPLSIQVTTLAWIDEAFGGPDTSRPTRAAARLLGALVSAKLFHYMHFLQHLQSRGIIKPRHEARTSYARLDAPELLRLLRSIPVHHLAPAQVQQRRLAIYGTRTSESHEEGIERRATQELRTLLSTYGVVVPDAAPTELPATALVPTSPRTAPPTADILDALQLRSRLPHVWLASPYVQSRIVDQFLAPALLHDVSVLSADGFAVVASVLTGMYEMEVLGRLMCALLDGHNLACVVSICHTIVVHACIFDALGMATDLVERLVPYAIAEPNAPPGMEHVVPAAGRGMAVGMARRALHALGRLDVPVPTYAPMPQAPESPWPRACAASWFDALLTSDASSSVALYASDEAASQLLVHALDRLAQSTDFPPAVLTTYMATLAGTVGVRLDDVVHAWIRRAWERDAPHVSSMWTVLVLGLVRHDLVDATRLLQLVLVPFIERAPASHTGWDACMALLYTLVFTYTKQGSACSIGVVGESSWYDVSLIRTGLGCTDGLVPLLAALDTCEAPQRWACWDVLSCQVHKLHAVWLAYPDAVWRGTLALQDAHRYERVRRLIHTFMEQEPRGALLQPRMASLESPLLPPRQSLDDMFDGALAALEWHMVLQTAEAVAPDVGVLLFTPHARRAPLDLLLHWDASPHVLAMLVRYALESFVHARDETIKEAISSLAHLMYAWRLPLACDEALGVRAVEALARLPASLDVVWRASAALGVLRVASHLAPAAWRQFLTQLPPHPLAASVAQHIRCLASLDVPPPPPLSAWHCHETVHAAPTHADPWATPLYDTPSTPLSQWGACKTRERIPTSYDATIARPFSERSYGDGDDPMGRYASAARRPLASVPRRRADSHDAAPMKRARIDTKTDT